MWVGAYEREPKKTTFLLHENYFLFPSIPSMHMIYSTNAMNYSKHSLQDTLKRNKITFYKKDIIGKQVFELLENMLCNCLNSSPSFSLGYWYARLYIKLLHSVIKRIRLFLRTIQPLLAGIVLWKKLCDFRVKSWKTFGLIVITNWLIIFSIFFCLFHLSIYLTILLVVGVSYERVITCLAERYSKTWGTNF